MSNKTNTVLVIEDEDFISTMVSRSLKDEGHNVIIASDYKSAIVILDTEAIDLVISDVMLPFTGGLDIVDYVRDHKNISKTPIILVTGMDKEVLEASSVKANFIMSKPFEMIDLMDKTNELLGVQQEI
jgi:DNA-binding response OmpR family regulator